MNNSLTNKELLKLVKQGDDESFFILYNRNQGLVTSLLKKYYCPKNEYEELKSNANFGLIKAIRNYSFDYNVEFSTYAVPTILGEIRKYFKEQSLIKVTRSNKERYIKINDAKEVLEKKLERSPTLKELSVYLEEDEEDIIDSINANSYISYLDQTYGDDDSIAQLDNVVDTSFSFTSKVELELALSKLSKKERLVIELRYFEGLSQVEVGKRLFLNQVGISRIEKEALLKLKKELV
ncbi:MAG: sigma-70 family RNA polymerase sigma factor [Bacilli bacterium]